MEDPEFIIKLVEKIKELENRVKQLEQENEDIWDRIFWIENELDKKVSYDV